MSHWHVCQWLAAIVFGIALSCATPIVLPDTPEFFGRSSPPLTLSGKNGGVATEVGQCSDIGVDVLQAGGSAADAIIASALCVGTIAAYHSGIGGGGFMLVRFNKEDEGIHAYEMVGL
jgi:gamma-glutamyltranspeptidase